MFRTLLVDDNKDFRHEVGDILRANFPSMEVLEAGDSEEGLRMIAAAAPNLVIMDIRLPGGDGLELIETIKVRHPRINLAILSAYDLPEYRQAALDHGASFYLAKESDSVEQLIARVRDFVAAPKPH